MGITDKEERIVKAISEHRIEELTREKDVSVIDLGKGGADVYDIADEYILKCAASTKVSEESLKSYLKEVLF